MAPVIAFILTLTCAAIAKSQDSTRESAADSHGTCQSLLEESMRVELLQERYSMGSSPLAAVPSPKAVAEAARAVGKASANATPAVASGEAALVANTSQHRPPAISSNFSKNASSNAVALTAEQPFPDLGGIISGVADAISSGGGLGDIVESVAGGATEALLTPITDAVNNTLTNINSQIVALAGNINGYTDQLVYQATQGWAQFASQLNTTLEDALDQFSVIPFSQISSALDAVGAISLLPPAVTDALGMIASVADQLSNATLVAQTFVTLQSIGFAEAAEHLSQLNTTLYDGLALVQTGTSMLTAGYQELSSTIVERLQTIPGLSLLPDAIMESVQTIFASAATTVNTIARQTNAAIESLVTGVERAAVTILGELEQEEPSGVPKLALGVAPLLAAVLAIGAEALS